MCSPVIINGLDDETESRTDGIDIFIHDSLHYRRLAGIVQTSKASLV